MNLYDRVAEWLTAHPIPTGGALALTLTALRVIMANDRKSFGMVCVEGLACGLLSMAFSYAAIHILNFDPSIGIFIGSTAGFIGIERIQTLLVKILDLWLEKHSAVKQSKDSD